MSSGHEATDRDRRRQVVGVLLLGFGVGGLADGIVLHQLLRWHHLISEVEDVATLDGLQRNVFWDGVFHASAAGIAAVGMLLGWWPGRSSGSIRLPPTTIAGLVLIGWGAFQVIDQLVFHLLLELHDIREGVENASLYNWSYFALGVLLAALGSLVIRLVPARPGDR